MCVQGGLSCTQTHSGLRLQPLCRRGGPEPLLTLAGYRRQRAPGGSGKGGGGGKICFGVKFNQEEQKRAEAAGPAALAISASGKGAAATQLEWVAARFRRCLAVGMPACIE